MANESIVPIKTITLATYDEKGLPLMEDTTIVDYSPSERGVVIECLAVEELRTKAQSLTDQLAKAEGVVKKLQTNISLTPELDIDNYDDSEVETLNHSMNVLSGLVDEYLAARSEGGK